MSNNARNIWLFCLIVIFYVSYWVWRLSDSYTSPFYSEEPADEDLQLEVVSKTEPQVLWEPEAKIIIDNLQKNNQTCEKEQNEWVNNYKKLVALGDKAIPTILQQLKISQDLNKKRSLLGVLEEIGDPLVRKDLEALLSKDHAQATIQIINTLVQLKCTESMPALEKLLKKTEDEKLKSQIEEALWELKNHLVERGDYTELSKILPVPFSDPKNYDNFINLYCKYPPLQKALNCDEKSYFYKDEKVMFLKAVNEWYYEQVLLKPSPYKAAVDFKFQEPFSEEKQKGWNLLCSENSASDKYSVVRVLPTDKNLTEADATQELTVLSGHGHGWSLNVYHFKPVGNEVFIHSFRYKQIFRETKSDKNSQESTYEISVLSLNEYKSLLASLHIIFSACIFSWWNGGDKRVDMRSTNNFAILFSDLEKEGINTTGFCGYPSSFGRVDYIKLVAAMNLVNEFVKHKDQENLFEKPNVALFSKIFILTKDKWAADGWWWVCDRMMSIAHDFGDKSILPTLANLLNEKARDNSKIAPYCVSKTIDTIAEITKQDFRLSPDGTPKPIEVVSKEYLDYIGSLPK